LYSQSSGKIAKMIFLSILIPVFNEELRIVSTLNKIQKYLAGKPWNWEIIIVDDGSTDRTVETVQKAPISTSHLRIFHHEHNLGKGAAIKTGMLKAEGEYILFMDADSSTPIEEFDKFLPLLESGFPIVIGSRKAPGAQIEKRQPFIREFLGKGFSYLSNSILGMQISDFTCGFKCFRKDTGKKICSQQTINGWSYDSEILFLAKLFDYPIKEVPIRWINNPNSRVKVIRNVIESFWGLLKIKSNNFLRKYE